MVTDPGVRASGAVDRVLEGLAKAGLASSVFDEIEPNPGGATVERGASALRAFGLDGTVVVAVGGGSAMDTAKALSLRATNDGAVLDLPYDGPEVSSGSPRPRHPDDRGDRRRDELVRRDH